MCASTSEADIDFLQSYAHGKSETAVNGKVVQWVTWIGRPREAEIAPLHGAEVTLSNSDQSFTSISAPNGAFRFSGVPPGDYLLSARLDPCNPDPKSYKLSVSKGAVKRSSFNSSLSLALRGFF